MQPDGLTVWALPAETVLPRMRVACESASSSMPTAKPGKIRLLDSVLPFPRFSGPDPVTLAYSLPQAAAVALVLPAVAVTMIALVPLQPDRSVRLRPVHDARDVRPPGDE